MLIIHAMTINKYINALICRQAIFNINNNI